MKRRHFLTHGTLAATLYACGQAPTRSGVDGPEELTGELDAAFTQPIFKRDLFPEPIILDYAKMLRYGNSFICVVRDRDGGQGISVSNNYKMAGFQSVWTHRMADYPVGKDISDPEAFITGLYNHRSNYKVQSLAIWVPIATLELAILDLLGRRIGKPIHELVGERQHDEINLYQANNNRGRSAEESVERLLQLQSKTGAKAVKFKIGGRMDNPESPAGRTARLIPLARQAFPADIQLYADANGSYNATQAIEIGRLLEANDIDFFEAPVPADWYDDLIHVTRTLDIPIADGEQEASLRNFYRLARERGIDIFQPDLFYFGGLLRSTRVARMAEVIGAPVVPHLSGAGFGLQYMLHQLATVPNAGAFHEYKGLNPNDIPYECPSVDFQIKDGKIPIPTGPGSGFELDPDWVARHVEF